MSKRAVEQANEAIRRATEAARRFDHEYVGTEHILLGLIEEGSGVAANVLMNLGIDPRKVRLEIEKIIQPGPGYSPVRIRKLPPTPRARKALEYAAEEARNLNHNYMGTEHLLLGVLREQEGVAAQVLMNLGVELDAVREEVRRELARTPADRQPDPSPDGPSAGDPSPRKWWQFWK